MVLKLKEINRAFHYDKTSVEEVLSTFEAVASPSKDDVESFLKEKAFDMENTGQSVTYLILNDACYREDKFIIDGYFTLAIKAFEFRDGLSRNARRRLTGKSDDFVPAFLIGQLARSAAAPRGFGKDMLMQAIAHIRQAIQIVGGRLIYLDCKDKLVPYYESNGFKLLQKQNDLNQMYLVV